MNLTRPTSEEYAPFYADTVKRARARGDVLSTLTIQINVISARALIYMLVGHVEHHMASLHEKYLPALQ